MFKFASMRTNLRLGRNESKKNCYGRSKNENLRLGSVWDCLGSLLGRLGNILDRPGLASGVTWAATVTLLGRLSGGSWTVLAALRPP